MKNIQWFAIVAVLLFSSCGAPKEVHQQDAAGNDTVIMFVNSLGHLVMNDSLGYAKLVNEYDAAGHGVRGVCYDAAGKRYNNPRWGGKCEWTNSYDADGMQTGIAFYNADGSLHLDDHLGFAKGERIITEAGDTVVNFYDGNGDIIHPDFSSHNH